MTDETKFCSKCQTDLPIQDFYFNRGRADGLSVYCCVCYRAISKESQRQRRARTIGQLGGVCVHCGYDADIRALQIDHIYGDGRKETIARSTNAFYAKVVANPDRYQLLCANCNQIKKMENDESVGDRDYGRVPPTERKRGVGRHNPEANARRAAGLKRWREKNPDAVSEKAKRSNADPEGRASRSSKMSAYWVDADGEKQVAHRQKINEAHARKKA